MGAGGHAKVVMDALLLNGGDIQGVIDPNPLKIGTFLKNIPILQEFPHDVDHSFFHIALGDNLARKRLATPEKTYETIIHPTAFLAGDVEIGAGTFVGAGVIINANVKIGKHVILNTGVIIEHDVVIEDYAHICPGSIITGGCHIGEGVLIGAGSTLIPSVRVGDWSLIGAGSTLLQNIAANIVAVGSPCKPLP